MPYTPELEALFQLAAQNFADNDTGAITPAKARQVWAAVLTHIGNLSTNQIKGAPFRVPFVDVGSDGVPTVPTALIPSRYRIVGMEAVAVNGTDQTSVLAGVQAAPMYFRLLPFSLGTVTALVDELPATTVTVKARWVRTSGTDEEKVASFPVLQLEDKNYKKGDVLQFTFAGGETRLVQWKADSVGFTHPEPTGLDSDLIYRNFAPLSSGTGATYDDTALKNALGDLAALQTVNKSSLVAAVNELQALGARFVTAQLPSGQYGVFSSFDQAQYQVPEGGLVTLYGNHGTLNVNRNLTIRGTAVVAEIVIGYGASQVVVDVHEITILGRCVACYGATVTYHGIKTGPATYFSAYDLGSYLPGVRSTVTLNNVRLRHTAAFAGTNQNPTPLYFLQRDQNSACRFVLNDSVLESVYSSPVTGYIVPTSGVELNGSSRLIGAAGQPVQTLGTLNSSTRYPDADVLVDNRPLVVPVPVNHWGTGRPNVALATLEAAVQWLGLNPATSGGGAGIDYTNPTTLSAAATLSANTAYYVTGNGYALTLPNAAQSIGKLIFIQVASAATGLYPIVGAGTLMMYALETMSLRATADGWKKTGGELRPMQARLETALMQQDALSDGIYIPFSVAPSSNFAGLANTANGSFLVQRDGTAAVQVSGVLKDVSANAYLYFFIEATPPGGASRIVKGIPASLANPGNGSLGFVDVSAAPQFYAAGTVLKVRVFVGVGSSASIAGQYEGNQLLFSYTELNV